VANHGPCENPVDMPAEVMAKVMAEAEANSALSSAIAGVEEPECPGASADFEFEATAEAPGDTEDHVQTNPDPEATPATEDSAAKDPSELGSSDEPSEAETQEEALAREQMKEQQLIAARLTQKKKLERVEAEKWKKENARKEQDKLAKLAALNSLAQEKAAKLRIDKKVGLVSEEQPRKLRPRSKAAPEPENFGLARLQSLGVDLTASLSLVEVAGWLRVLGNSDKEAVSEARFMVDEQGVLAVSSLVDILNTLEASAESSADARKTLAGVNAMAASGVLSLPEVDVQLESSTELPGGVKEGSHSGTVRSVKIAAKPKLDPKDFLFSNQKGQRLMKKPGDVNGMDFTVEDLDDCHVLLLDHTSQVLLVCAWCV
jgi:hypothetical protein